MIIGFVIGGVEMKSQTRVMKKFFGKELGEMKSVVFLFIIIILSVIASGVSGTVALSQNFEGSGFSLGSLGTAGQGSAVNVGGLWQSTAATTDPSIVFQDSNSVRLTNGEGMAVGHSDIAPISQGNKFIVSFSVNLRGIDENVMGSFYMYVDNFNNVSVDTKGIALYTETNTAGFLRIYDGKKSAWRVVRGVNLFQSRDSWVDFKLVITTWDDGTGYGLYDTYINVGSGWKKVDSDNPFVSTQLHDGVNSMLLRPRSPVGEVLAYFDNIYISSTPIDCMDVKLLGYEFGGDFNEDCDVDIDDLTTHVDDWLKCNKPNEPDCEATLNLLDQNFDNTQLFSPSTGDISIGDAETRDGLWLGLEPNDYPGIDDTFSTASIPVLKQNFDDTSVFLTETAMDYPGRGVVGRHGGIWRRAGGGTDPRPTTGQAYSGTQSLRVTRDDGGTLIGRTEAAFVDVDVDSRFEASFRLYRDPNASVIANINSGDGTQGAPLAVSLSIESDGRLKIRNAGDNTYDNSNMATVNIPANQWVGLKMEVDLINARTHTYYDDGSGYVQVDNHGFDITGLADVNAISFIPQTPETLKSCYIDDVEIIALRYAPSAVLEQDFDNIDVFVDETDMAHPGIGFASAVYGIWDRAGGSGGDDPKPTDDQASSGTKSIRITRDGGTLVGTTGYSSIDVDVDTSFEASFSLYRGTSDASMVANFNSEATVQSILPISLMVESDGRLKIRNAGNNAYEGSNLVVVNIPQGQWIDLKMVVDLVNGRTDTYYDSGSGFVHVDSHGFKRTDVGDVDSVAFLPQLPSGNTCYIDNVKIVPLRGDVAQSLRVRRDDTHPYVRMISIPDESSYKVEVWVYRPDANSTFGISLGNDEDWAFPGAYEAIVNITASGAVNIYNFDTSSYIGTTLLVKPQDWYKLCILVDRNAGNYTFTIQRSDGILQSTGHTAGLGGGGRAGVKLIKIGPNAPSGNISYVDGIKVILSEELSTCAEVKALGLGLITDSSGDCVVNLVDFAELATGWLECNDPANGNCELTW